MTARRTAREATSQVGQFEPELHEDIAAAGAAVPVVADILRRARAQQHLTLRQVEQKIGIPNAHLSQIERGVIRRPDVALLLDLAELYELDYRQLAEWTGYLEPHATRTSARWAGMALKLFTSLDPVGQREALHLLEQLRNAAAHTYPSADPRHPQRDS